MSSERMTDLELADAVLDVLESEPNKTTASKVEARVVQERREDLEWLFADLRARGAL